MTTPMKRGRRKEASQAELAKSPITQEMTQLIESSADFYWSQLVRNGMQDKPAADLMVRFYKAV